MMKQEYMKPSLELIPMEAETVIAMSGTSGGEYTPGPQTNNRSGNYNRAQESDLEDLINDLFTIEQ